MQSLSETIRRRNDTTTQRPIDKETNISKPTTVSEHFVTNDHTVSDISLIPLERIYSDRDSVRKGREAYLTKKGKTLKPFGLTKKDEMQPSSLLTFYVLQYPVTVLLFHFLFSWCSVSYCVYTCCRSYQDVERSKTT